MAHNTHMTNLSDATFKSDTAKGVVLIDFYADWCGPCRMLSPILDAVAERMHEKVLFGKLNIDENQKVTSEFGVTSIPTVIVLKDGKEVRRVVGVRDEEFIADMLNSAL
jgi:thioredoxin 1